MAAHQCDCHKEQPFIVQMVGMRALLVCDTKKEVYAFLKVMKNKGATGAILISAKDWGGLRLTENGNWIWTDPK